MRSKGAASAAINNIPLNPSTEPAAEDGHNLRGEALSTFPTSPLNLYPWPIRGMIEPKEAGYDYGIHGTAWRDGLE